MENFKQTLKEVFSIAPDDTQSAAPAEVKAEHRPERPAAKPAKAAPPVSFLAAGTAFEGTLRAAGDVEIAGSFKGSISSNGAVKLCSDIESSVTAGSLTLLRCTLTGDVVASGSVTVSEGARITGNVTAKELLCAGEVNGDLKIAEGTTLEQSAQINGRIVTGTIAVVKGAIIKGGVEMKPADVHPRAEGAEAAD